MDKERIERIAFASGFEHKQLDDGSMGLRPYVYEFAQAVESEAYRDVDQERRKDYLAIISLREKVAAQASEILRLRTNASNAINCLGDRTDD